MTDIKADPSPSARSYPEYLRLDELLHLQTTLTSAHDELQFIVVHQVSELWFKLLLFELESTRTSLEAGEVADAVHLLSRIHEILRVFSHGFDVIETMRPWDFLEFRSRLQPASGFQSFQFREVEFICGTKDPRYVRLAEGASRERLARRLGEPTLWDAYLALLERHGLPARSDADVLSSVIQVLKGADRHALGPVTEGLIELDEQVSLWRQRHIRMTMRMIGTRPGTGKDVVSQLPDAGYGQFSQGGVEYLKTTLHRTFFPILWEARTFVER